MCDYAIYVQDAVGDKYCYTVTSAEYKAATIKHARWWMRQRNHRRFDGKPLGECRPLLLVIEAIAS